MIGSIVDGGDTAGLLRRIVQRGSEPRLVAHSATRALSTSWWDTWPWYRLYDNDALNLALGVDDGMDEALVMRRIAAPPVGPARHWAADLGRVITVKDCPNHVWYCTLTLHPDEPSLPLETWRDISTDLADEMELSAPGGKQGWCWVAVHSGPAPSGADMLHVVANTVNADGRKWSRWRDQWRLQIACNTLEHRYGLHVIQGRDQRINAWRSRQRAKLEASS